MLATFRTLRRPRARWAGCHSPTRSRSASYSLPVTSSGTSAQALRWLQRSRMTQLGPPEPWVTVAGVKRGSHPSALCSLSPQELAADTGVGDRPGCVATFLRGAGGVRLPT
jgi:hypothetical protein